MKCRLSHLTATWRAAQAAPAFHVACAVAVAIVLTPAQCVAGDVPALSRADTLWIFDADFEDLLGDNAGWTTEDLSGTVACVNYWHKDTIRIRDFTHLGDSTWWCGTYNDCWTQPRGYGNNWTCMLSRSFPELASAAQPGDDLVLEYDQRFAIEACYDYAYTDVSTDGGASWTTLTALHNPSCWTFPGISMDWDNEYPHVGAYGHMVLDMSEYAGQAVDLRFRFTSDSSYSSQDAVNNPPLDSMLDGAWQIDNIAWHINDELFWLDDCESPGANGWVTDDTPASGQTGVAYHREFLEFDGHEGWMMAAYDSATGAMVGGQRTWLYSPPIYLGGATEFVVRWDGWVDLPDAYLADWVELRYMSSDEPTCVERHLPRYNYRGWRERAVEPPVWVSRVDTTDYYASRDWLGLAFFALSWRDTVSHGLGIAFDRIRVGIPSHTGVPDANAVGAWVSAAYPNPLGRATTVSYGVTLTEHVALRVYDLSGRVVRTLVDEIAEPGEHRAVWDGTTDTGDRAASGVYFVKLEDAEGRGLGAARKLVLLK